MTYHISITKKSGFLHAIITGQNTRENVEGYMAQLFHEAQAADCQRLLIEERLEGPRLDTITVFQIVSAGSSRALGIFKAIAYVDIYAEGDTMEFAETVGVNRSIPVNIFSTIVEAENWLLGQK